MREIIHLLQKPSRYLGSEINAVHKDPDKVRARVALAFPDLYEVGMSYVGQRILYHHVNRIDRYWAERVFAPGLDAAAILRQHELPLTTLESDTPLREMDLVAFSLTHELCYTNVLYMLDLGGIPLKSEDRQDDDPLVIAGGGSVFNAEPVAPFFDCLVVGDGEEILPEVLEAVDRAKEQGLGRGKLLEILSAIPGVSVPNSPLSPSGAPVEKRTVPSLEGIEFPTAQVVPFGKPVHDRLSMEIARGCTRGCRFCQAGMIYRPVRERSLPVLDDLLLRGLQETGYEELSFLSLSSGDFSTLTGLFEQSLNRCTAEKVAVSLPSLRVGSVNPRLMSMIASIRRTGVTLAPEAGSQRLRDAINKGIREEELLEHVTSLFSLGWHSVKLYFMIGLPTETRADLEAIKDLAVKVLECGGKNKKRLQITVSISPFVPKPHTPFQWERQISREECRERIDLLKELLKPYRRIKLRWHDPDMSFLEGVFSRGDRALAPLVEAAYRNGALFSSWIEHLDIKMWEKLMQELSIVPESYLRERGEDEPLPWDHISSGLKKEFLLRERKKALQGRITSDCRFDSCHDCGVCTNRGKLAEDGTGIAPRTNLAMRDQSPDEPVHIASAQEELSKKEMLVRIWHEKIGLAQYLSQLELQTIVERALRRADLKMTFSGGFHPGPLLSFGRALPVGVSSREEWFSVWLREETTPSAIIKALKPHLPEGLDLLRIEIMPARKRQPQALQEDFILSYDLPEDRISEHHQKWYRVLNESEFIWEHETRKGRKSTDLRPFVARVESNSSDLLIRFNWECGYLSPLKIMAAIDPQIQPGQYQLTKSRQWMQECAS